MEIIILPVLLYVLCAMSAMGFIVAAYHWFWLVWRGKSEVIPGFSSYVWQGQAYGFVFAMIVSIFAGFYDYLAAGEAFNIIGEVAVLALALGFAWRRTGEMFGFGMLCLLGWGLTVAFGGLVWLVLKAISVMNSQDFVVSVVFLSGLVWSIPILFLYGKILTDARVRPALGGQKFYMFLWPVLLAYLVLLVPLMVQQSVNSPEWREYKYVKPLRRA